MEVLGIHPVQRLVTPRMLACGLVALLLNSLVATIGIVAVTLLGVRPGRESRRVRRRYHVVHRRARGRHLLCQGIALRSDRWIGLLLSRPDHLRRRRQGRRQRRQRNGGLRVHVAIRDERGGHRHRHSNVGQVTEGRV